MSVLASLARAYDRLSNAPALGYSSEKIGFLISLNTGGSVVHVIDLRDGEGKKKQGRSMHVPGSFKRPGTTPRPFFLWDNANYALGVSLLVDPSDARFGAFRDKHIELLRDETDTGLVSFRSFLSSWQPVELLHALPNFEALKDQKVAFALEEERTTTLLHDRPRSRELWNNVRESWREIEGKESAHSVCLVLGVTDALSRTHPPIRGIPSKGGKDADSIVSFNLNAFTSYGHVQGENAPVSEVAAFKYTTALNRFLERDSGHRIQLGGTSTVFWADASADLAAEVEALFAAFVDPSFEERSPVRQIADKLAHIRDGKPLADIEPDLEGVRFYVLGLAPNAARLSVRFYFEDSFGVLARNYQHYVRDMAFEPWPKGRRLSIAASVLRTAPARVESSGRVKFDRDQISPLLSGELLRAILTGSRFPGSLLSLLLLRVRSDHLLDSARIALIKGLIVRAMRIEERLPLKPDGKPREDYLVRSDPDDPNDARRLGRLFAVIERAQLAALGDNINATVKDKFLSAAAATPQQVFVGILKNAENHIKRLRNGNSDASWITDAKHARAVAAALNRDIGNLWGSFPNGAPKQHSIEEQGLFLVGYYQERYGGKRDDADAPELETTIESEE